MYFPNHPTLQNNSQSFEYRLNANVYAQNDSVVITNTYDSTLVA